MMLQDCNLFPHGLLPLHIFEPRYREMLADVLEGDRMFCIGTLTGPETPLVPENCIHQASTAAFVRACVAQEDGCSNLMLQGVQRVSLGGFRADRSYVTAAVQVIPTTPYAADDSRVQELMETIRGQALARPLPWWKRGSRSRLTCSPTSATWRTRRSCAIWWPTISSVTPRRGILCWGSVACCLGWRSSPGLWRRWLERSWSARDRRVW